MFAPPLMAFSGAHYSHDSPENDDRHLPSAVHMQPRSHSLPWNPLPYMSPSVTHQPELLLLQWMLRMLEGLMCIESVLQHPLVLDPIPSLFVQFRNALHQLAPLMLDARPDPGSSTSAVHSRLTRFAWALPDGLRSPFPTPDKQLPHSSPRHLCLLHTHPLSHSIV